MIKLEVIAQKAGVSKATVSRVINNSGIVAEETKNKVYQAISEFNIQINDLKRSKETAMTIGIILPFKHEGHHDPFVLDLFTGAENKAFENDYMILMGNSGGDIRKEISLTRKMIERGVEGIVMLSVSRRSDEIEHFLEIKGHQLPLILVDQDIPDFRANIVKGDNLQGSIMLTNHLISLNHRRIGIITLDQLSTMKTRSRGYHISLLESGIPLQENYHRNVNHSDDKYGYRAAVSLLQMEPRPTAVFLTDPHFLIGMIKACEELNISIPRDLSVVSFDDGYVDLPEEYKNFFTVISQSAKQMGTFAVEILFQNLKGSNVEGQELSLQGQLHIRKSTATP